MGYLRKDWVLVAFKHFAIVFSTPENFLVGISGALGLKESHFLSKICVWENSCGVSQKQWMPELSNLCHCVLHPWKLTSRDFWSSRNAKESHFLSKNVFWENAVGYLRNSECYSFQTIVIVFCTPENLLVGISGALGNMFWEKESHFLIVLKTWYWEGMQL